MAAAMDSRAVEQGCSMAEVPVDNRHGVDSMLVLGVLDSTVE